MVGADRLSSSPRRISCPWVNMYSTVRLSSSHPETLRERARRGQCAYALIGRGHTQGNYLPRGFLCLANQGQVHGSQETQDSKTRTAFGAIIQQSQAGQILVAPQRSPPNVKNPRCGINPEIIPPPFPPHPFPSSFHPLPIPSSPLKSTTFCCLYYHTFLCFHVPFI